MQRLDWAEIIRLKEAEGLSFSQIAQRVGKTKGSVYNAYRRAKSEVSRPSVRQDSKPLSEPRLEAEQGPGAPEGEPEMGAQSEPEVHDDRKLKGLLPDLDEMVSWWRKRKETFRKPKVSQIRKAAYIPFRWLLLLLVVVIVVLTWGVRRRKSSQ